MTARQRPARPAAIPKVRKGAPDPARGDGALGRPGPVLQGGDDSALRKQVIRSPRRTAAVLPGLGEMFAKARSMKDRDDSLGEDD